VRRKANSVSQLLHNVYAVIIALQRHVLKYERLLKNTRRPDVLVKEIKVLMFTVHRLHSCCSVFRLHFTLTLVVIPHVFFILSDSKHFVNAKTKMQSI